MTVLVVSNPRAGKADEGPLADVGRALRRLGPVESIATETVADLESRLSARMSDATHIVVAGGDGTLNCAINAARDRLGELVFGIVPMGTGNDLARTLGIDGDPVAAARALAAGHTIGIDLGRASAKAVERLFINACMGGYPVEVDEAIDGDLKSSLGPLSFWIGGVKALGDFERFRARVDDEEFTDCVAIGVGNGRTVGGGIELWPRADPADGVLDVCVLAASNVAAAVKLAVAAKGARLDDVEDVQHRRARRLTVTTAPQIGFNADGELTGLTSPASFEIVGTVRLLVPLPH